MRLCSGRGLKRSGGSGRRFGFVSADPRAKEWCWVDGDLGGTLPFLSEDALFYLGGRYVTPHLYVQPVVNHE